MSFCFFFSSRRRHTRYWRDWSSDVCSSDLTANYVSLGGDDCSVVSLLLVPVSPGSTKPIAAICDRFMRDRKSTRLNSSHANISYAVFCLKKKKSKTRRVDEARLSC